MTLYETIVDNSIQKPQARAYVYFHYTVSHATMLAQVDEAADALAAIGVKEGTRVALALPNSPKMLILLYAINKLGAVVVLLNPKSPAGELYRQLHMTQSKYLFFSSIAYEAVVGMKPLWKEEVPLLVPISIMEHMPLYIRFALGFRALGKPGLATLRRCYGQRVMSYTQFLASGAKTHVPPASYEDDRESIVIFSGGTNGTFKAVVHSNAGLYQSAVHCLKTEEPWPPEVTMLAILPAFHIFGLSVAIHLPLVACGCIILVPVFNLGIVTKIIKKECPGFFPGVPTIFERLLHYPSFARLAAKGKLNFSKFRHGFVGGDNLSDEVRDAFNEMIRHNHGDGYISMGYGMSECCPVCVNNRTSHEKECIGIPFDTMQLRILKEGTTGEIRPEDILPEGELGEIAYASSYLMLYGFDEEGVRNDPIIERTKDSVTGKELVTRWIRTGDLGYLRDGKVFYRCRERRIIKVSGNTIFADSIERVIESKLEVVRKAYVVPVPHALRGYVAYAFLELEEPMEPALALEKVQQVCRQELIPYAIPVGVNVLSAQEVPRTAIGKVAWGLLENRAKELTL